MGFSHSLLRQCDFEIVYLNIPKRCIVMKFGTFVDLGGLCNFCEVTI